MDGLKMAINCRARKKSPLGVGDRRGHKNNSIPSEIRDWHTLKEGHTFGNSIQRARKYKLANSPSPLEGSAAAGGRGVSLNVESYHHIQKLMQSQSSTPSFKKLG
jgi:hypothetical protein